MTYELIMIAATLLLTALASSPSQAPTDLEILLQGPTRMTPGQVARFEYEMRNVGQECYYVFVPETAFTLNVDGHTGSSTDFHRTIPGPRLTRRADDLRFLHVPLCPGGSFRSPLGIPVNDMSWPELEHFIPAGASVRIELLFLSGTESAGEHYSPAWRGHARSNVIDLQIEQPTIAARDDLMAQLRSCADDPECLADDIAGFYMMVCDSSAGEHLLRILARAPALGWIADALVFQAATAETTRIERMAAEADSPTQAAWLRDLANRIRNSDTVCASAPE